MGIGLPQALGRRDDRAWLGRGLQLIFVFGIACLLSALITFTAHNWTYLSTIGKLFGLATLLLGAAGLWARLGLDKSTGALVAGIAAQILIGVWLAAAGQLYQAPGGLQDLLIVWAVLGLPFAIASKYAGHWAVWLALIFGISVSPAGQYLAVFLNDISFPMQILMWAVIFSGIWGLCYWRKAAIWLVTAAAFLASGYLFMAIIAGLNGFDTSYAFILAALIASGLAVLLYTQKRALAALSLFTVTALSAPVSLLYRIIAEAISVDHYVPILLITLIFGAATLLLIRLFAHYRTHFGYRGRVDDEAAVNFESHASQDKSPQDKSPQDKTPWYMDVFIAIGGILTAGFATGFIGIFLATAFALSGHLDKAMLVIGLGLYALFFALRLKQTGAYLSYLFGTMLLIGQITAITGFTFLLEKSLGTDFSYIAYFAILLAAPILWLVPQRMMEVIQSAIITISVYFIIYALSDTSGLLKEPMTFIILSGFAALCFFVQFKGYWRIAASLIFLLGAMFAGIYNQDFLRETQGLWQGGPESIWIMLLRAGSFVLALAMFAFAGLKNHLPSWPILAAITVIVALLPGGAAGAALILFVGYGAGLRSYFLIGTFAALYFLFAAYYDLRLTLMELSAVLALSGAIFLGIWHISRRKISGEVRA